MQLQKYTVLSAVDSAGDRSVTSTDIETVNMTPCSTDVFQTEVLVKGQQMIGNFKRTLGKDSYCVPELQEPAASITAGEEIMLEGDEDSDTFRYLRIVISPCSSPPPGITCWTPGGAGGGSSKSNLRKVYRDLRIQFSFMESIPKPDSHGTPIDYAFNTNYRYSLSEKAEKVRKFYFMPLGFTSDDHPILEDRKIFQIKTC